MQIIPAHTADHLPAIRTLFREYADTLAGSVCLKDFDAELAGLPGRYAPPKGQLFLALDGQEVAGCVGLREVAEGVCEMKRLYVRPRFRGQELGRQLANALIDDARQAGYKRMRLDTLPSMHEAVALYESLGFLRLPSNGGHGCSRIIDMELLLG